MYKCYSLLGNFEINENLIYKFQRDGLNHRVLAYFKGGIYSIFGQ